MVARRAGFLAACLDAVWAARYRAQVARFEAAPMLARAVASGLFQLMACRNEYEVAGLHLDGSFGQDIAAQFEGRRRIRHHLAPPLLSRGKHRRGRPR
jgi:indolepyruvate ferredoxin oxidoreductase